MSLSQALNQFAQNLGRYRPATRQQRIGPLYVSNILNYHEPSSTTNY